MKTLFLNPNSNASITDQFRRHIAALVRVEDSYEVKCLNGAPSIIASARDNALAQLLLESKIDELSKGFTRLVLMSSLDTGFDTLRDRAGLDVHGFTRSVLAYSKKRGRHLHAITFDESMTPLYKRLFAADGNNGVVEAITVLPCSPADVADKSAEIADTLRDICHKLEQLQPSTSVFIVGAVGLQFSQVLRHAGHARIIDPVADMLTQLGMV